jgi:hypothetical protein
MRRSGQVASVGEEGKVYKVSAGEPEGKRPIRRPGNRWENGIRLDLREICWGRRFIWLRIGTDGEWLALLNMAIKPSCSGVTD